MSTNGLRAWARSATRLNGRGSRAQVDSGVENLNKDVDRLPKNGTLDSRLGGIRAVGEARVFSCEVLAVHVLGSSSVGWLTALKKAFPVPFQHFSRATSCPAELQIMMTKDENERIFAAKTAVTDVIKS